MNAVLNRNQNDEPKFFPELISSLTRPLCLALFAFFIVSASLALVLRSGVICSKTLDVSGQRYFVSINQSRTAIYVSIVEARGFIGRGRSGTNVIATNKAGSGAPEVNSLESSTFEIGVSPGGEHIIIKNGNRIWQSEPRRSLSFVASN